MNDANGKSSSKSKKKTGAKEISGIKDIARSLGVSPATVSLALNDSPLVNEDTMKKVKTLAKEVDYVPNSAARKLVSRRSDNIGLIIPDTENIFYASLIKYVDDAVKRNGHTLLVAISNNNASDEMRIVSSMIENRVEGVVIVPLNIPNPDTRYIRKLESYAIPYVFCSDYYPDRNPDVPVVMSDLEDGMYRMTKSLIDSGYRNLAYLSGSPLVKSLGMRLQGFSQAVRQSRTAAEVYELSQLDYDMACETTRRVLAENPDVEAFVCVNDLIALAVVNTLSEQGISVPNDKGVSGFDNVIFSRFSFPKISTVNQDIRKIADESVASLMQKRTEDLLIPTELIRRGSLRETAPR